MKKAKNSSKEILSSLKEKTSTISKELSLDLLKVIYKTRLIDEKMDKLVKQNKGGTFFLSSKGHEIIGAFFSLFLKNDLDWAFPYYRDRAFTIGFGCDLVDLFAAFLTRDIENHSGGRMMLDHFSDRDKNIPAQSSCVGSQFLQAVGVAKGIKLKKEKGVVYVSAGDGATSQGDFHEALNFSSIHNLPIVFVIQDNGFAISTPSYEQTAGSSISEMISGYHNLLVLEVEGNDFEKLSKYVEMSVEKARDGKGPSVVVVKVPRLAPHTISDDPKKYKTEKLEKEELLRDPLSHLERYVLNKGYLKEVDLESLKVEIKEMVEKASLKAEKIPFPKKETADEKLFKEFLVEDKEPKLSEEKIVMMDALNRALVEEMEEDGNVLVFGQDVARGKGGVFGISRKLTEKFNDRCFNTPLAESTIIGIAIGLSLKGFKPVCEIQFSDYCFTGMNQLLNELSSFYYRSNGMWNCPVVIRMTCGGYIQGGPYHSQSLEAIFNHIPGLKVVIPSNALDAKRLLKTAIKDPNPVIFLEHKALYRQRVFSAREESSRGDLLPFGKASIVKEGEDITVVCWGMAVFMAYEVACELKDISIEVIDLRTLNPLDMKTILESLKKSGRVIVFHEAWKTAGFGAEILSRIVEEGFEYLDAPVKRVAAKDVPIPYCRDLEDEVLPQKQDLKKAILELHSF
jgi:2-oxoisovalerate dehydrogenase E1 component